MDIEKGEAEFELDRALDSVYRKYFLRGKVDKSNEIRSYINTLTANINNEKLSDAQFREFTRGVLGIIVNKL